MPSASAYPEDSIAFPGYTVRRWLVFVAAWISLGCRASSDAPPSQQAEQPAGPPTAQPAVDALMKNADGPELPVPALPRELPPLLVRLDQECRSGQGVSCVNLAVTVTVRGLTRAPMRLSADILKRGCDSGSMDACGRLGVHLLRGWGLMPDGVRGADLLERACGQGSSDACAWLGTELSWGAHLRRDAERGRRLLLDGCDKGIWHACAVLNRARLVTGKEFPVTSTRDGACARGSLEACEVGGSDHLFDLPGGYEVFEILDGGYYPARRCDAAVASDCPETRLEDEPVATVSRAACERGSNGACDSWITSTPNDAEQRRRSAQACQWGYARACVPGADPTTAEGLRQLEDACPAARLSIERRELVPSACARAASVHRQQGNKARALVLFARGCWGQGRHAHDDSCVGFGDLLLSGELGVKDPARGIAAFASACRGESRRSCARFGDYLQRVRSQDESDLRKNRRESLSRWYP